MVNKREDPMKGKEPFLMIYYKLYELQGLGVLTSTGVSLISLIHNLDYAKNSKPGCWASNLNLAETLGVKIGAIVTAINGEWKYPKGIKTRRKGLDELGLISYENSGKKRVLFSNLSKELVDKLIKKGFHEKTPSTSRIPVSSSKEIHSEPPGFHEKTLSTSRIPVSYNNIKNNIKLNKKNINLVLHPKAKTMLSKMKKSKQEEIEDIYQVWNTYATGGAWHSHRKLTPDMVKAIGDNLKTYTLEDICTAIHNYASVLQESKYFWDYVWPLSAFLSVKDGKTQDAYKKWWRFLPENFVVANYIKKGNGSFTKTQYSSQEKLLNDPIPDFTEKLIKAHRRFTPKGWEPTIPERNKFIQATLKAQKQVDKIKESWVQDSLIFDLLSALTAHYSDKGGVISPGHYCSDFTWDTLLYQFIVGQGVNPGNLFNYSKNGSGTLDTIVAEEKELTEEIEKNMCRQDNQPKPITDETDLEFDYIKNI